MDNLWTDGEISRVITGRLVGQLAPVFSRVVIDSRDVQNGDIFFALKGEKQDGHTYVAEALAAGAKLIIVHKDFVFDAVDAHNISILYVEDTLAALWQLAEAARARSKAKIVAVTGSVGKTSTKQFLANLLSLYGSVHVAPASFNNHIGVPLTLARLPAHVQFAIFEIGMNHAGEIRALVKIVRPHLAIITKIAPAHLQSFTSVEQIAVAKAEIFEGVEREGVVLLNHDDDLFDFLQQKAQSFRHFSIYSFGCHAQSDYQISHITQQEEGIGFDLSYQDRQNKRQCLHFVLNLLGRHMIENAAASLACVHLWMQDLSQTVQKLAHVKNVSGRGSLSHLRIKNGTVFLIDETYNANPVSMQAALEVLAAMPLLEGGRRIAVLGDMLELGEASLHYHENLSVIVAEASIDVVFLLGENMQYLYKKIHLLKKVKSFYIQDCAELYTHLVESVQPNDIVMLKASHSMGFGQIVEQLKRNHGPIA